MATPLVTIRCLVYNHEPYLRQCLDGFVMQKTNFPFEAIVHDDASTDRSAEIIREYAEKYPDIIKPIFETENQYSKKDGSLRRIMDKHMRGKYIAMCEGDDYWIDPLKLQKQVDFLENHREYGMCYTLVNLYFQSKGKKGKQWGGADTSFDNLLEDNCIPTLTCVMRKELRNKYIEEINPSIRNWNMGDYPMWLWFAVKSKIACLSDITGVYRVLDNSISHSSKNLIKKVSFVISSYNIKLFFAEKYKSEKFLKIQLEYLWWQLICAILRRDAYQVSLYVKRLKCCVNLNLRLKQKIILFLCEKSEAITYYIVYIYIRFYLER